MMDQSINQQKLACRNQRCLIPSSCCLRRMRMVDNGTDNGAPSSSGLGTLASSGWLPLSRPVSCQRALLSFKIYCLIPSIVSMVLSSLSQLRLLLIDR